jgi:nitrogen fixation/metabolism regulation signal transduction histidine kinase
VENERANLAIILARLSTGVVSLENDLRIRTANQAAGAILGVDLENRVGELLPDAARGHALLTQFLEAWRAHAQAGDTDWREQIVLHGQVGRRVLMCACTSLPDEDGALSGSVVVFDDITALLQAQRDAAWGEVARRLAHEIKNPLTPIQLSAERMRKKYLGKMPREDAQVLERATHTIVQQVEAMKEMVNAFSDYARAPDMDFSHFDINELISEVADLYRAREMGIALSMNLDRNIPAIEADDRRIRQILHNLMRNALEAMDGRDDAKVQLVTRLKDEEDYLAVEILVVDNGPGFQMEIEQVFDPYVTSKPKGTGLGLAIVKKLVEEHGGRIDAENSDQGGARIRIILPVDETARTAMLPLASRRPEIRREQA